MRIALLTVFTLIYAYNLSAQKYFTRNGELSFYSEAPLEKIEAHNKTATCVLDTSTGRLEMAGLIKAFQFEKALMQEHFNENYMESHKYPKAVFKGEVLNMGEIDLSKVGKYDVVVKGDLTLHGTTQPLTAKATLAVKDGHILGTSSFDVQVADYQIEIPSIVRDKIAKVVRISVRADLKPL